MNNILHRSEKHTSFWHAGRPTIGFVNSHLEFEWASRPWQGVQDAALDHQVNLVSLIGNLVTNQQDFGHQANVLYALADARRLDGLIIWKAGMLTLLSEPESETFCRRFNLPLVTIEGELSGAPCVTYSNYAGMQRLMTHLIEEHNYRRIGFVGMYQHHAGFQERYQAYRDTLQEHGLVENPAWTQWWFPDEKILNARIEESLFDAYLQRALGAEVEALVGVSDTIAEQLLESLRSLNIRVPYEVAVAGFDGFSEGLATTPPLTTVDPGWHTLGYQAMTTIVQMLAGEPVSPSVAVPGQLLIRQSCGCVDHSVTQAARQMTETPARLLPRPTTTVQELNIQEIQDAFGEMGFDPLDEGTGKSLIEALQHELTGDATGQFLLVLEPLLQSSIDAGKPVLAWQDALSILRKLITPLLNDPETLSRAEDLWHQSRVLIGNSAVQAELVSRQQAEQRMNQLRGIEQTLIATFDVSGIMDVLASRLPEIGIPRCYVATFEQPKIYHYPAPATEWAILRLAYDENGRRVLPPEGLRFPSWQLTPPGILPIGACTRLVAQALYFKDEQIGFVLFEAGPRDGQIYEALRSQLSSALQGALLVQRVQERSAEITRQKYILDNFMANVPDSIYFKDRESRILQVNQSLANHFGMRTPDEAIGKTDFDFFPEQEAQAKYDTEQTILRTGQAIFDHEEPYATGSWVLSTKMPLRDEHGEIIGTFGISRDITELKRTQQGLKDAYTEIRMLNEQLKDENLRMQTEMELAHQIQTSLLPIEVKHIHPDFEVAALMLPADEVGGDYYDIAYDLNHDLWFSIGDVSGHGVTPGLIMMMAQTIHTAVTINYNVTPKDVVVDVNKALYHNVNDRLKANHFMTFTSLKYLGNGRFQHAGAHLDLVVYRQRTRQCELIDTDGVFLNFIPDIAHATENAEFSLDVGDLLVLYTDGLTEAMNAQDKLLDIHGFLEIVARHADEEIDSVKDSILRDVLEWCDGKRDDDMSLVVIRRVQ